MNLSIRNKRILTWVGLPLLGLVTFVMAMHWTFPYDRLKGRIEDMMASKYTVSINEIEPTFLPGGIILKTVVLESKPTRADEQVTKVVIDQVRVDIGLLGLIGGKYDVDLVAKIAGGQIEGSILLSKSATKVKVSTSSLGLANVPGIAAAVGLPMTGELNAEFDLTLPKQKWAKAKGKIKISCPGCTIGDGKTKVKPRARPGMSSYRRKRREAFIGDGVPVPKLSLGDFSGEVEIKDGVGTIKRLAGKSKDGEIIIAGSVKFSDPFKNSTMPACLKFKVSPELGKRDPQFANFPALMGVPPIDDGWSHVKAKGKLSQLRWLSTRGKACVPGPAKPKSRSRRPRVTTRAPSRKAPARPKVTPPTPKPPPAPPATANPLTGAKTPAQVGKKALRELKPGGSGPKLGGAAKRAEKRGSRKRKDDVRAGDDDDDDDDDRKADDDHKGDDDDDVADDDVDRKKDTDDEYDGR